MAAINLNGSIYLIADEEQRTGKTASDNERLNLVMADGTDLICLWRDVVWSRSLGVTSTLWNQAIKLNKTERTLLETGNPAMASGQQESEEGLSGEQVVPIVPETSGGEDTVVSPVAPRKRLSRRLPQKPYPGKLLLFPLKRQLLLLAEIQQKHKVLRMR